MGTKTGIEWTDSTWSPIRAAVRLDAAKIAQEKGYTSLVEIAGKMAGHIGPHCEHVSPGCEHCYAETNNHRCLPANGTGLPYDRRSRDLLAPILDDKVLLQPMKWGPVRVERLARVGPIGLEATVPVQMNFETRPRRIFVENQSDLFGDWVTDEMIDRVFAIMANCPEHIFQVLTKRPARMLDYFTKFGKHSDQVRGALIGRFAGEIHQRYSGEPVFEWSGLPMPNVWLGVSVENQAAANERIPLLLRTPSTIRFISAEPLLGSVDITAIPRTQAEGFMRPLDGRFRTLEWVICGGESGPGARPMHPDWARSLRDQCVRAGVPFFFKQWGEYKNGSDFKEDAIAVLADGRMCDGTQPEMARLDKEKPVAAENPTMMRRVGKKAAGAELDGVEWKQFPKVPGE